MIFPGANNGMQLGSGRRAPPGKLILFRAINFYVQIALMANGKNT